MDGQTERCLHCGATVTGGRFCTSCGARLGTEPTNPRLWPGPTDTAERVYESSAPAYLGAEAAPAQPAYPTAPEYLPAERSAPRPGPGPGLWIGVAAAMVLVLVLGGFLLLQGTGGDDPASVTPPIVPEDPAQRVGEHQHDDVAVTLSLEELVLPGGRGAAGQRRRLRPGLGPGSCSVGRRLRRPPGDLRRAEHGRRPQRHLLAHSGRRDRDGADLPPRPADPADPRRPGQRLLEDRLLRRSPASTGTSATGGSLVGRLGLRRRHHGPPAARHEPRDAAARHQAGDHDGRPAADRRRLTAGQGPGRPQRHRDQRGAPARGARSPERGSELRQHHRGSLGVLAADVEVGDHPDGGRADRRDQHARRRGHRRRTPPRRRAAPRRCWCRRSRGRGRRPRPAAGRAHGRRPAARRGGRGRAGRRRPGCRPDACRRPSACAGPAPRRSPPLEPTTSEPTGAPSPFDRHTDSTSAHAPYDASGTPVATWAFQSRAPSRCTPMPTDVAQVRSASRSASGSTAPPAKLWVFSTETAAVRTKNGPMSGANIDSIAAWSDLAARVAPGAHREAGRARRGRRARPGRCGPRPRTAPPARPATSDATASTLAIEPVGVNSAASLPNIPATRSCSATTVGSSP